MVSKLTPIAVVLLCSVALIGAGYAATNAYTSSVTTNENTVETTTLYVDFSDFSGEPNKEPSATATAGQFNVTAMQTNNKTSDSAGIKKEYTFEEATLYVLTSQEVNVIVTLTFSSSIGTDTVIKFNGTDDSTFDGTISTSGKINLKGSESVQSIGITITSGNNTSVTGKFTVTASVEATPVVETITT